MQKRALKQERSDLLSALLSIPQAGVVMPSAPAAKYRSLYGHTSDGTARAAVDGWSGTLGL